MYMWIFIFTFKNTTTNIKLDKQTMFPVHVYTIFNVT